MEYYSAIRRKQILPFATTWMDLEGIMLIEISQAEKDKFPSFVEYNSKAKLKEQNSSRLTDSKKGLVLTKGKGWGGQVGRREEGIEGYYYYTWCVWGITGKTV